MKIGIPLPITSSITMSFSLNNPENDYPAWSSGTTYDADDFVIVAGTTHKVYQSVQGSNTNHDPVTDDGTWWTEIGATNRWKPFDGFLSDQLAVSDLTDPVRYFIDVPTGEIWGAIALFNIEGTQAIVSVQNEVDKWDTAATEVNMTWTRNSATGDEPDPIYPGPAVGSFDETSGTSEHYMRSTSAYTLAASEVWTAVFYVYENPASTRKFRSEVSDGSNDFYVDIDVDTDVTIYGTSGNLDGSGVVDEGGGWWKVWLTFTVVTPGSYYHYIRGLGFSGQLSYTGLNRVTWMYRPILTQEADQADVGIIYWRVQTPSVSAAVSDWYEAETGVALDLPSDQTWVDPDVFDGFTALPNYEVTVAVYNSVSDIKIGQIVPVGTLANIGATEVNTAVTAQDFSTKEVDAFGFGTFVQRGFSREVEYAISLETTEVQRSIQLLNNNRATPVVWLADSNTAELGTIVYGWWDDYAVRLEEGRSPMTVTVKGLT